MFYKKIIPPNQVVLFFYKKLTPPNQLENLKEKVARLVWGSLGWSEVCESTRIWLPHRAPMAAVLFMTVNEKQRSFCFL